MNNNDILIRLRYALDLKNTEMVEIFKLGNVEVSLEDMGKLLKKSKDNYQDPTENVGAMACNNTMLDAFLNGFITFKRGKQEVKPGQTDKPILSITNNESVNNIILKKLKIAMSLTSEDMLDILEDAGITIAKSELSAVLRKEGHSNYKECGDRYVRNFLKGLAIKHRE